MIDTVAAIAFFTILMTLKMFGKIDWPWWIVTAPLWVWFLVAVVAGILVPLFKGRRN